MNTFDQVKLNIFDAFTENVIDNDTMSYLIDTLNDSMVDMYIESFISDYSESSDLFMEYFACDTSIPENYELMYEFFMDVFKQNVSDRCELFAESELAEDIKLGAKIGAKIVRNEIRKGFRHGKRAIGKAANFVKNEVADKVPDNIKNKKELKYIKSQIQKQKNHVKHIDLNKYKKDIHEKLKEKQDRRKLKESIKRELYKNAGVNMPNFYDEDDSFKVPKRFTPGKHKDEKYQVKPKNNTKKYNPHPFDDDDIEFEDQLIECVVESVYDMLFVESFDDAYKFIDSVYEENVINDELFFTLESMIYEKDMLINGEQVFEATEDELNISSLARKRLAKERYGNIVERNRKFAKNEKGEHINPEEARKQRLRNDWIDKGSPTKSKKGVKSNTVLGYTNNRYQINLKDLSVADEKMLRYLNKKAKSNNPEDIKKYKQVHKMLCAKYNIKPDSQIWTGYKSYTISESDEKIDSKRTKNIEKKHVLPPGYTLIHKSPKDNLTHLNPSKSSDLYSFYGAQYNDTGRVYFVLVKKPKSNEDLSTGRWGVGNHIYELDSKISGFYVDAENSYSRGATRAFDIEKAAKDGEFAVFVKTDKPLKVKQIK